RAVGRLVPEGAVRVGLVVGIVAAALTAGSAASAATPTHEGDGLQICVPVAGPWVVVPTGSVSGKAVEYQLDCPRGYVVGGLGAGLGAHASSSSFPSRVG